MTGTLQPLTALAPGTPAEIVELRVPPLSRPRLLELGLLPGTPVELLRFALLGDPVEVKVRGYNLSLPRHEADHIWVRVNPVA